MLQRLTARELLRLTDIGSEAAKSMRRRRQIALAFAADNIVAGAMYTPMDAVCLMLSSALAKGCGATMAASLIRAFADVVLIVVADAETGTTDVLLAVADLVHSDGRRAYLACGADAMIELATAKGFTIERATTVNISAIIRSIRANEARVGIDLSGSFLPAPTMIGFTDMVKQFQAAPMGVTVETKFLRKRDALARKLGTQVRMQLIGGARQRTIANNEVAATAA
jgi:hypothetical protein